MKNKKEKNKTIIGINASFLRKPQTGIGQVTLNFLRKLSEYKVESRKYKAELEFILYLEEELPKKIKLPKNFQTRVFLPPWKRDDLIRKIWWEKFSLPRQIREDKCQIFLSLYQCPTVLHPYMGVKHLMLTHDIIPRIFPQYLDNARKELYWRLTERGIKKANHIIAISKRTEKDLIQRLGISGEKITVNYIDVDEVYRKKPTREKVAKTLKKYRLKPGYILAGGGMETRKNIEGVMRAYKILLDKNKNLHFVSEMPRLVIYGKLMPKLSLALDAERLARKMNLTRQIKFLGMVPQEDMPALFLESSLFVYPSHYEGFGLPPLEAMNQGVATIVSKTSSLPEVCGDAALYCDANDPHDIAMVMKNALTHKNLRETLSQRGRERSKKFSWKKFTKKIVNMCLNH